MRKSRVLIISNPLNHEGGIVNYYNLFFNNFKSNEFEIVHFSIGSRAWLFYYPTLKKVLYLFYLIYDIIRFFLTLVLNPNIKIIQVSPSLIPVPLIRDGILVLIAKILRRRVIVFYRGWKLPTLNLIKNNKSIKWIFNTVYQKNTKQIVLASSFKNDLKSLYNSNLTIDVTTTAIEKSSMLAKDETKNDGIVNVLFLARIQDLKGIFELIDAIVLLNKLNKLNHFHFTIAGHEASKGVLLQCTQKLEKEGINNDNINFSGRVEGHLKYQLYSLNDVYVLPSYTEGCPNSVLEALASGLYCITTDVGALFDIIKPGVNGSFVKIKSSEDIVKELLNYLKTKFNTNFKIDSNLYKSEFDIEKQVLEFNKRYKDLMF
jgi:glycosyltransferase involved in cell wall biosynthesis